MQHRSMLRYLGGGADGRSSGGVLILQREGNLRIMLDYEVSAVSKAPITYGIY
jgi:hypothetical protein